MWPDWVSNLGPLALESDAISTVLHGPATYIVIYLVKVLATDTAFQELTYIVKY